MCTTRLSTELDVRFIIPVSQIQRTSIVHTNIGEGGADLILSSAMRCINSDKVNSSSLSEGQLNVPSTAKVSDVGLTAFGRVLRSSQDHICVRFESENATINRYSIDNSTNVPVIMSGKHPGRQRGRFCANWNYTLSKQNCEFKVSITQQFWNANYSRTNRCLRQNMGTQWELQVNIIN